MKRREPPMERRAGLLSERTHIQLGGFLATLMFVGGCVWWGGVQSTKLDAVLADVHAMRDEKAKTDSRIDKLDMTMSAMMALKEMRDGQIKNIYERLDRLEGRK